MQNSLRVGCLLERPGSNFRRISRDGMDFQQLQVNYHWGRTPKILGYLASRLNICTSF